MNVPFLDLRAQYASIREEISESMQRVIDSCAFAGGPFVDRFETEFAAFCGTEYAAGVSNGTEALLLALMALGIGEQDEVITVPNSFFATAEAICYCGANPIFIDVDERTYTMDPTLLEKAITPRTKAIIPVHLFGQTADMDLILEVAREHGLFVIEDAAQAHGAEYKGKRAGTLADVACFSFYPGKNLGAYGEAGAVVTHREDIYRTVRMLRDHGQSRKYYHDKIGWNARMDGLQGAVLSVKLKYLEAWNNARWQKAEQYTELLDDSDDSIATPKEASYGKHIYHIYAIRSKNRDSLISYLREKGIHCGIHYPVPIHLQKAYAFLGLNRGSFPITERCSDEFASLPMFPELTDEQVRYVAEQIKSFVA